MRYKNIAGRFFGLVTKHACDRQTDGQTDGQNYDSQDRASIASRGKNCRRSFPVSSCLNLTTVTSHLQLCHAAMLTDCSPSSALPHVAQLTRSATRSASTCIVMC